MISTQALDRKSSRALYEQLTDELRNGLLSKFKVGDKIPTEDELVKFYRTSRSTVRRAVHDLVEEGLLVRRQGKGTFVTQRLPKIVHEMDSLRPFYDTFLKHSEKPSTVILDMSWVSGQTVPEALRGQADTALFFRQVYRSANSAHLVADVFVAPEIGKLVTRRELEEQPIFGMYSKLLPETKLASTFTISCSSLPPDILSIMELSAGAVALLVERDTRTTDGRLIDHADLYLRSDVYRLRTTLTG